MVTQSQPIESFGDSTFKSAFSDSSTLSASIWTDKTASPFILAKPEAVSSDPSINQMLSGFDISFTSADVPAEKRATDKTSDFEVAKETFDKLLSSKSEVTLPNGLQVTKSADGVYELKLPGGNSYKVNTTDNTINSNQEKDGTTYSLSTDKDGNILIGDNDKDWDSSRTIKKDGSVIKSSADRSDPSEVMVEEYPAHGEWRKISTINEDGITEHFTELKKPFKDASGSEIEFQDDHSKRGKVIFKTADGQTLTLKDQVLTITQKDGSSKTYISADGERLNRGTRSDCYVKLPNGVVVNFGHNAGGVIEIKNPDGSLTSASYGKPPRVTRAQKK